MFIIIKLFENENKFIFILENKSNTFFDIKNNVMVSKILYYGINKKISRKNIFRGIQITFFGFKI